MSPTIEPPSPPHVERLKANLREVSSLIAIHGALAGRRPGRKRNVEVLNKSAIVLLVACWEAFVEDLAAESFSFLFSKATSPAVFPTRVLTLASKELRDNKDESKVWVLAGEGWRPVLQQHQQAVLAQYIGKLNTPRPKQIDELLEKLVGVKNVSSKWQWKGTTAARAAKRLDDLVTLRGEIAHRVATAKSVKKRDVMGAQALLGRLAAISSNHLAIFIKTQTTEWPWLKVFYGKTTGPAA